MVSTKFPSEERRTSRMVELRVLTRFSGGIEVQHMMTPLSGSCDVSADISTLESLTETPELTIVPIVCHTQLKQSFAPRSAAS